MSAAVASDDSISTFPMSKSVNLPFLYAYGTMSIPTTDAFVASTTKARGPLPPILSYQGLLRDGGRGLVGVDTSMTMLLGLDLLR
jgi:hypothetical protein